MSDELLQKVLANKPSTWSSASYGAQLYVTVPVPSYSSEYREIQELFVDEFGAGHNISNIERVQHPFAYGRFLLRKEQLDARGQRASIQRKLRCVKKSQIVEALQCNVDARRINIGGSHLGADCLIVVEKHITNDSTKRDSDSYPEYVIYYDEADSD